MYILPIILVLIAGPSMNLFSPGMTMTVPDQGDIIKVLPNPFAHGFYQVHYLKPGENRTYFDFNCWGCNVDDIGTIENETGLMYWVDYH